MDGVVEITGVPQAVPNVASKEVRFALTTTSGDALLLRAKYGVIAQIASTFGNCLEMLRVALQSGGEVVAIDAPSFVRMEAHKDAIGNAVILSFITDRFIPYQFKLNTEDAEQFADMVKAAAAKQQPTGNA